MPQKLQFWGRNKKTDEFLINTINNRNIVLAMLRRDEPMTHPEIAAEAKVNRATTYYTVKDFVKANLAKSSLKASHANRTDRQYELTAQGEMFGIAVSYESKESDGINNLRILRRGLQPEPKDGAMDVFVSTILLNALDRGLLRPVLKAFNVIMQEEERTRGDVQFKRATRGITALMTENAKQMQECTLSALSSLTDRDRRVVMLTYKRMVEVAALFGLGHPNTRELEDAAVETAGDIEHLTIPPFRCPTCHRKSGMYSMRTEDWIVDQVLKRGVKCSKCNKFQVPEMVKVTKKDALKTIQ